MTYFFLRAAIASLGLWLASEWVDGLSFDSGLTLILAAILLGLVNALVRPLLVILTLPLTIVTLGFFLLVVNGIVLPLLFISDIFIPPGVAPSWVSTGGGPLHTPRPPPAANCRAISSSRW